MKNEQQRYRGSISGTERPSGGQYRNRAAFGGTIPEGQYRNRVAFGGTRAEPSGRREGNNGRASGRQYRNRPPSGSNIRDQYQRFSVAMLAQAVCLTVLRHLAGTSSLGSPTTLGAASCSLSSGGALHCLETLRMHVTAKRRCTALLPTVVPGEAGKDLAPSPHGRQHHAKPFEEARPARKEVDRPSDDRGHACSDGGNSARQCYKVPSLHLESRAAAGAQAA